jgi:ferritin-like metal-binding protein YciE
MELKSLEDLYVLELRDIYSAEAQLLKALPKMAKAASSGKLRSAFQEHEKQTKAHVERLEKIFNKLGKSPRGKRCKGMEGLIEEGNEMIKEDAEEEVRDAGLISAAQRVEHYEIAAYGTARAYATTIGDKDGERLLQQTLNEEEETDKKLTQIAVSSINLEAAAAHG